MGLIPSKSTLEDCMKISVSAFARRRLPVVLVKMKMAETLKEAITYIEQGRTSSSAFHMFGSISLFFFFQTTDYRVGPDVITDPAFLCTRYVLARCCTELSKLVWFFGGARVGFAVVFCSHLFVRACLCVCSVSAGRLRTSLHGRTRRASSGTCSSTTTNWTISICYEELLSVLQFVCLGYCCAQGIGFLVHLCLRSFCLYVCE